jgi:hypothetical protein
VVVRAPAVAYHDVGAFDLRQGFGGDSGAFSLDGAPEREGGFADALSVNDGISRCAFSHTPPSVYLALETTTKFFELDIGRLEAVEQVSVMACRHGLECRALKSCFAARWMSVAIASRHPPGAAHSAPSDMACLIDRTVAAGPVAVTAVASMNPARPRPHGGGKSGQHASV